MDSTSPLGVPPPALGLRPLPSCPAFPESQLRVPGTALSKYLSNWEKENCYLVIFHLNILSSDCPHPKLPEVRGSQCGPLPSLNIARELLRHLAPGLSPSEPQFP